MTPEAENYLAKAASDLENAYKIAAIKLPDIAARSAYYAAFHAAEALIVERVGKIAKTHSGVRTEFARLMKEAATVDRTLITFLAQGYKYKEISDYSVGQGAVVTDEEAQIALGDATRFVEHVKALLSASMK